MLNEKAGVDKTTCLTSSREMLIILILQQT